jgi:DNA-binding NarL/FixJ family response regulator
MQRQREVSPQDGDPGNGNPYGVILLHPYPVVREALGLLLETQPDLEVLITADTWDAMVQTLSRQRRRTRLVAIVALELAGDHDAQWSIGSFREQFPSIRVVAIGAAAERMSISRALFGGADGFIDQRANPIAFLNGIRRCAAGEMVLEGVPLDWLGPIAGGIEQQGTNHSPLTLREREVLAVAAEGLRAKDIAERLGVAERTVTTHLARIYEKLGVNSRVAAVMTASRSGLLRMVPPPDTDRARVS